MPVENASAARINTMNNVKKKINSSKVEIWCVDYL